MQDYSVTEQYILLISDMKRVIDTMIQLEYDEVHNGIELTAAQSLLEQFIEDCPPIK